MVVTESMMYWVTRMDHIGNLLLGVGIFMLAALVAIAAVSGCLAVDGFTEQNKHLWATLLPLGVGCALVALFLFSARAMVPTTKEYAAIKVIPLVANSEEAASAGKEAKEILGLASEWAKDQLRAKTYWATDATQK